MSYRIEYGPTGEHRTKTDNRAGRIRMMTAAFFLLFCLSVRLTSPESAEKLEKLLLPGEKTATEEAFQIFLEDLREGASPGSCVEAFCRRVVQDAGENLR